MALATLPFVSLIMLAAAPARAETQPEMPRFLRILDRAVNAGDWTLQCDSSQFCQIIGVVTPPRDNRGVRAVVMIQRGIARDAAPGLRMAFVEPTGALAVPPRAGSWRLISRGLMRGEALPLGFGSREADGAYRASPEAAAAIIAALVRWPGAAVHDGERRVARMPRGDLGRLMRRMDRLQHPDVDPFTPAERAQWLKEYHYTVLRTAAPDDGADRGEVPEAVSRACDTGAFPGGPFVYRVGPRHRIWIAECPEGNRLFMHPDGADPILFEMRDNAGVIQKHDYAGFGGDSLLALQIPHKGRIDCGQWVKFGFFGEVFQMIVHRRYDRCRAVPYDYWPKVWYPTSWRYADAPPSDGGNAPPARQGVNPP